MAQPSVLGISSSPAGGTRLSPLTADRAKPAVPFGRLYRLIAAAIAAAAPCGGGSRNYAPSNRPPWPARATGSSASGVPPTVATVTTMRSLQTATLGPLAPITRPLDGQRDLRACEPG